MWRQRLVAAVLSSIGLFAFALPVSAQDAAPWNSFPIPGTLALLTDEAGWPAPVPRVQLARELLRYAYATTAGTPREVGHLRRAMYVLLDVDAAIQKLKLDQPLVLKPEDRARRGSWQSLFGALGYDLSFKGDGSLAVKRRRGAAWDDTRRILAKAGLSPDDLTAQLSRGQSVSLQIPFVQVPLPLGLDAWKRILQRDVAPAQLFAWLLANRTAAMLYIGFTGLDPQTLALFTTDRAVMDAAMANPLTFAEFSPSLRVSQGRVVSPLGPAGDAAWREVVGVAPTSPGPFIERLLRSDDGRMAWFYDAVVNDPLPTQRYVLAAWLPDARQAKDVRRAYDAFRFYRGDTYFLVHPFLRSTFDPELAIQLVRVNGAGVPDAPASVRLLSAIFDDTNPTHRLRADATDARPGDELSAGEFLDVVFSNPVADARPRAEAFAFAQRLMARIPGVAPDDLAVLLRGHMRFPSLVKTLERVTPSRPASLTAAVLRAESFRTMDDQTAAHVGVLQFQSGLALIEAMTRTGGLPPAASEDLVLQLSQVLPQTNGYYGGRLARWFGDVVVARLRLEAGDSEKRSAEDLVRMALTGTLKTSPLTSFEWHGQRYDIDPGADALDRLTRSLASEKAPPFDRLVTLVEVTDALAHATSPDQIHALTADLEAAGNPLIALVPTDRGRPSALGEAFQNLVKTLNQINSPGSLGRTKRVVDDLHVVTDWVTGYALLASVYAARLGDPDDLQRLGPGMASLHDLGTTRSRDAERAQVPWYLPFQIRAAAGQTWHIEGSVLGLEMVLGSGEKIGEGAPTTNAMREDDLIALAQSSAESAIDWPAQDMAIGLQRISQSLERGRTRLPSALAELALRPGANHAAIAWALQNEPESVAALVPISEIFSLGNEDGDTRALDAWGVPMARISGCLCLEFVPAGQTERLAEYADREYLASFTINLRLKLAELMAQMHLPAELAPALFVLAMRDIVASPLMRNAGSWADVAAQFERITAEQIDGYMAVLVRTRLLRMAGR